jgi:hypothetical protein
MKKIAWVSLAVIALLVLIAPPSDAWVRGRVIVGVGPGWWGPPWWYYPPYPAYVYAPPPTVVVEQPPVYVQQQPPPPPPAPAPPQAYWHYCPSAHAYYPNVQTCSEPWVKVAPRTE